MKYVLLLVGALLSHGALAATKKIELPDCDWTKPGHNPYTGDKLKAVDDYPFIPADTRDLLKQKMAKHQYDDVAHIRKDSITGKHAYEPTLGYMHSGTPGAKGLCKVVTRKKWTTEESQSGLVYSAIGQDGVRWTLIDPAVCRNISIITRREPEKRIEVPPPHADWPPLEWNMPPYAWTTPLEFEPPSAGAPPPTFEVPPDGYPPMWYPGPPIYVAGPPVYFGPPPVGNPPPSGPPVSPPPSFPPEVPPVYPPITAIPEPSTYVLFTLGLIGMFAFKLNRSCKLKRKSLRFTWTFKN